jgi:hypothetical protein
MNQQFFEFWGNFFNNAARGQQQLDDMTAWMKQGFEGLEELSELFRRSYGLKTPYPGAGGESATWQQAIASFQKSVAQFAAQSGWVSQADNQQVLDRCAALETTVRDQQATIAQLRGLLAREGLGYTELMAHLEKSFKDQSEQFKAIMRSLGHPGKEDA